MIKKITYNSPVILTFTFISFCALVLAYLTDSTSNAILFSVYRSSIFDPLSYVRLFTHVLGHASVSHFYGNFLIILLVGPMLEEKYGSKNILYMILITAFVTGLINIVFFSNTALIGASGIAFMFILLSSFTNVRRGNIPLTLIIVVFIFIGKEIVDMIAIKDNISHLTHIIGGFCGGFFGYSLDRAKT